MAIRKGKKVGNEVRYGPYKRKDGRKVMSSRKLKDGKTTNSKSTSTTHARHKKEAESGKQLPQSKQVDHKNNNKRDDSSKNLRVTSRSENIAKGNRNRKKR